MLENICVICDNGLICCSTFMKPIVNIVNKILCVVAYQSEIFKMNEIFIKIKVNEQCNIMLHFYSVLSSA